MADGTRSCCGTSILDNCTCPPEREETTFDEVVYRVQKGTFYDDYDWASGPALRALRGAEELLRLIADAAKNVPADCEDFKIVAHVPGGYNADKFRALSQNLTAGNFRKAALLFQAQN